MTKARDIASAAPAPSTVSATELGYLDGVTSNIQTQIDSKTGGVATDTPPASPTEGQVWLDTDGTTADANFVLKSTLSSTGDIFYASSANNPARLGIGSTNQVLTVSGGVPTWATPAADTNGFVYITSSTFSNVASVSVDGCFTSTYETYMITIHNFSAVTTADTPRLTLRYATQDLTSEHYSSFWYHNPSNDAYYGSRTRNVGYFTIGRYSGQSVYPSNGFVMIGTIGTDTRPTIWGQMGNADTETAVSFGGISTSARTYTGFKLSSSASNISGTVRVYGLVKS